MLEHACVPEDLRPWLESAALVDSPAGLAQSRFPAMVASMLVVRLTGRVELDGRPVPAAAWIGASRRARSFRHLGAVKALGLVLRPEAATSLFAAARGSVDRVLPMPAVAGLAWAGAEQDLRAAPTDSARMQALFQFIRAAAQVPDRQARRQQALALMQAACAPMWSGADVAGAEVAGAGVAGVGRRQFERRFSALLGMPPKQFQLIARHNQTLRLAAADPARPGAQLALDGAYFDQSHMTRDMRRFAGHPLRELLRQPRPAADEHWPLAVGAAAHQATTQADLPDHSR